MVKLILVVGFLSCVSATSCLAAETCQKADGYISTAEKVDNIRLAKAIKCLAAGLANKPLSKAESIHYVEKIQLLAGKIIGNGLKPRDKDLQDLSSPTLATAVPSAPDPSHNTSRQSALYAQAIICESDKILQTIDPERKAAAQKGWCRTPKGSPVEIKMYAGKIIGNG
jgi:hypothetical protein